MKIDKKVIIRSLIICFIPAIIGGLATSSSVNTWYPTLSKPDLNPPGWIFGPVWTVLYFMQGLSLYLLTTTPAEHIDKLMAKSFFYSQLVLNTIWPILFFYFRQPKLGLIEIVLLVIFVGFTILTTTRINKKAGLLLIPYFVWICFATYLNLMISILNK